MASTTLTDSEKETNRSDKEYAFDEEQSDAILGKIGVYHHNIASVVQYSPEDHAHVLPSLKTCSDLALSNLGLGSLERLPIELLHEMLLHLDISSVFKFRQINPRAREFVDSIHQYQALVSHGINLFRGLLQTGLARQKSLSDFFDLFCTMKCSFCENFGGFVCLLIWKRYCFICLLSRPETQKPSLSLVRGDFRMMHARLARLGTIQSPPGIYGGPMESCYLEMISLSEAKLASGQLLLPLQDLSAYTWDYNRGTRITAVETSVLPYYDKKSKRVETGIQCLGCFKALVQKKSWVDKEQFLLAEKAWEKIHLRASLLEHFRRCRQAQILWETPNAEQQETAAAHSAL